ncbi:M23 family metallopeptidase [Dysosmobacter sp.]|uniref:M23 family metallopeptidase n=1 Tax=Dysosmobacter sp. TaxID=2591382 RepID=UPI002A86A387|nr:M23 family metallopeptidase [Dysosmobacter sp.]MDY3985265.1 M23 family metallopeptidase [Dysosmobacter sp.]
MKDQLKRGASAAPKAQKGGKRLAKAEPRPAAQSAQAVAERPPRRQERLETAPAKPRRTTDREARPHRERTGQAEGFRGTVSGICQELLARMRRTRRRWRHIVREKRAKHFPESERLPIQLLLFGWSMLPMAASRLREATWGRRKRAINNFGHMRGWMEEHRVHPAVFLGAGCGLAAIALFCSIYTVGTTVTYDGEVIGVVSSRETAETARANLEKVTTRTLGETFTIDDSQLQYSSGLMRRQDVVDGETFEEELSEEVGLVTQAYCLYVDGERIGATPYEGALEELLKQMRDSATNADTISCSFAEDVKIKQEYVATEEIMNLGYLAETLYSTKTAEVTYEVKKGDTWSEIAEDHGLTSKELLALNPGYDINKLQIGEVLTLSASVPYLTMTVVQQERYVDEVMYDIEYTNTDSLYKGDYKVTSAGQYGAADVVANVTYVNGEETERTVLSSVTLKEPVTEQRLQGTKARPTWLPTGTFRWPVSGRITSYFGGRKSPGGIGSTNHKGIDIAAPRGTPVYSADGGTVTYAGWMSGYGYLVRISHGNGYETYYGHNSSLTVSVGQKVYKGQQVARVGSTGNSTGNHCHFEVRYNGVAKNPLNYLP